MKYLLKSRMFFKVAVPVIYLSMILRRYGRKLGEKLSIYNEEALQAFLNECKPEHYDIHNGYISSAER